MPEEYRNAKVNVFCNDCEQTSIVPFHVLGGKCLHCRSYNTMRDKGEIFYLDETPGTEAQSEDTGAAVEQAAGQEEEESKEPHP